MIGLAALVLWSPGRLGVGWVAGHGKATSIQVRREGFRYHTADGKTFAEWGWQWAPWTPAFAGTDFRRFKTIAVELRLLGPRLPDDLLFSLASPGDHHTTERDPLSHRESHLKDGCWHRIVVPLDALIDPKGLYDPAHTIQIILGTWNVEGGEFTVDVRKILLS